MPRKLLIAVVLATFVAPAAAHAAKPVKGSCTSKVSDRNPATTVNVAVFGTITPKGVRPVRIERRSGTRWVVVDTDRTRRGGGYDFIVSPGAVGTRTTLRVVAPRRKALRAVTCHTVSFLARAGSTTAPRPLLPEGHLVPAQPNAFRAIYALPSDRQQAPFGAALRQTIDEANRWFGTQTPDGVQPRWLRDAAGAPVLEVLRLPRTTTEYAAGGITLLREDVNALSPPADGSVAVVWTDQERGAGPCGITSGAAPRVIWIPMGGCGHPSEFARWPEAGTFTLGHEMTHALGAVPSCAPHAGRGAHVVDDPRDVMWMGEDERQRDTTNVLLDPGHDDYFLTGSPCGDIATSPLWNR